MVQKVQVYEFVQFLNKVGDVPVVVHSLEGKCKPSGGDAVAGHLQGGRLLLL